MRRWFWRIYWPVAALVFTVLGTPYLGPRIETAIAPKRVHDRNINPVRTADRFCWTWSSDKTSDGVSDNVDVFIDVLGTDGRVTNTFVPPLTNMRTGQPWQSANILHVKVGDHSEVPYCVDVPNIVKATDRIRVRFTPIYHGWHDLWVLPLATPDMVDPPLP